METKVEFEDLILTEIFKYCATDVLCSQRYWLSAVAKKFGLMCSLGRW